MVPSSVTFWFYCIISKVLLGWEQHIVYSLSVKLPSTATVAKQNHQTGKDETEKQDMQLIRESCPIVSLRACSRKAYSSALYYFIFC